MRLGLCVMQGPAFFLTNETDAQVSAAEYWFALAGIITCSVLFVGYLMYQVCYERVAYNVIRWMC